VSTKARAEPLLQREEALVNAVVAGSLVGRLTACRSGSPTDGP
jgi:hypothetical protein